MNYRKKKIRVGISTGDINGIGIEIFLKVCRKKKLLDFFTPILFGSTKLCSYYEKILNIELNNIREIKNLKEVVDYKINVLNIWKEDIRFDSIKINPESGKYPILSLKKAVKALKEGKIDVLVTAPVNKKWMNFKGFHFLGHTEYLQTLLEGESLMLMIHDTLKIALVTNHLSLKNVSSEITIKKIIKSIKILHQSLIVDFSIEKPKIAVLGCNPHSGENGLLGEEEKTQIKPAIDSLFQKKGLLVFGPYSPDGFFGNHNYRNFDAVLAMYHDQGLIPFKILTFNEGVNFTAGLSHIRTSPDHGVAYDIAKKGKANEKSFEEAIFSAIKIFNNRKEYMKIVSSKYKSL
ncbi:MAG: 4-hydroxythreonine-4-phosphate dehydrogenase PdxA [Flavobacteriales bacterium]|jgi:4-hydroxythreonine-4-phosphate dehydrogenase|uniref:4-hydroxythreonine-4-phosphate dehydrogenase PdxA n=1 Tax=Blattabacterium sp. (Mastotermes darwiniensis) TaxID=39768 RepID=UPI000231DF01|nr:4-hydroxythreonine-4-phosphate dehydrogenase PdxA [Blattabacterium sp. (Mastotermes darwiniensis)]AER40821.1 4-hydroxythreonin-phosphate dehydrogenase [Blattabacterium sp. (Mastotermes darwiniensis) str. MADAR]MDR1804668.1 4-hydroxythreonine-4-phosphate dehydrogenase PdxA [Flavobacteriales bacterium]